MSDIIKEKHGLLLPIGTIWCYKSFYVTNSTEKEKQLCLCKLCLNERLLFQVLHKYSEMGDSLSAYLMGRCDCTKDENGFWRIKCCIGKCTSCKSKRDQLNDLPGLEADIGTITFYKFEEMKTLYYRQKTGEEKISKKVERSKNKHETPKVVHDLVMTKIDDYLLRQYQAQNDSFVWKHILESVDDLGPIFHMNYSENLGPTAKIEAQSAHFSKRQFSLHCTLMHCNGGLNKFVYHLSDYNSHDSVFMAVINDLITKFAPDFDVLHFKSDNCSTQYKCKYVFYQWRSLAMKLDKTFIVYYGVSGHGKGLVDAMSGFGVKTPVKNAIVNEDFFFNNTEKLQEYLISLT